MEKKSPFVLLIMDGWGVASPWGGNATSIAKTPTISLCWQTMPRAILGAAGVYVGLPEGEMGNSEVGHLNIGSGRIVHQDFSSISASIKDKTFFNNKVLKTAFETAKNKGTRVHLMGLLSDGGVHSHDSHLFALIDMAKKEKCQEVLIHVFTDGRDSAPMDALSYISKLVAKIKDDKNIRIASISGRYYAMDRENKWDRTEKVYRAMVEGMGEQASSADATISQSYRNGRSDEFIFPTVLRKEDQTVDFIKDGDVIIMFNFRADRSRQITSALISDDFDKFQRVRRKDLSVITFTSYQENLPVEVAFSPQEVTNTLAETLSKEGLKQLHIAETAKYPHVTYFFNGGVEKPFPGEDRIMIDSPKVATYDKIPAMSAVKLTDTVIKNLPQYDFIVVNYANCDMVGHTGNMKAAVMAVHIVDECVGRLLKSMSNIGGSMLITADHGNVEQMLNPATGQPDTEHTTNNVPLFLYSKRQIAVKRTGKLSDIAPTILDYLGLTIPKEMTGQSLVLKGQENQSSATRISEVKNG